jgi:antitoxin VapB
MVLLVEHPEADQLARELARQTGEPVGEAVVTALRQRLQREQFGEDKPRLRERLLAIGRRCATLPVLDSRSPEEILGYDPHGIPR